MGVRPKAWAYQDLDAMSKPMTCEQAVRLFFSYIDRALAGEKLENLQQHLEACIDCCDRLQFSRQIETFVRDRVTDEPLPDGLESRLRDRLRTRGSARGES
jgi:mycothiol system anti-sigma-R factor